MKPRGGGHDMIAEVCNDWQNEDVCGCKKKGYNERMVLLTRKIACPKTRIVCMFQQLHTLDFWLKHAVS
jgi:hypothetical protein